MIIIKDNKGSSEILEQINKIIEKRCFLITNDECFNDEGLSKVYLNSFELIKNGNESQKIVAIRTISNLLSLKDDISLFPQLLEEGFIQYLFIQLSSDQMSPFLRSSIHLLIQNIIIHFPEIADSFIRVGFFDIFLAYLPDKSAASCITTCINFSSALRAVLIQNQFHKKIIKDIDQCHTFNKSGSYFVDSYVRVLLSLQPHVQFDNDDYFIFLNNFNKSFSTSCHEQTHSQKSFIKFLLKSEDPNLILCFLNHPCNFVVKLVTNFNRPPFTKQRTRVFHYFGKIISSSPEIASSFGNAQFSRFFERVLNLIEDQVYPCVSLILLICQTSNENCVNLITESLFESVMYALNNGNYEEKQLVFKLFLYLLQIPQNTQFFSFFENNAEDFLNYCLFTLETQEEMRLITLNTLNKILNEGSRKPNLFCKITLEFVSSNSFQSQLDQLSCSENECVYREAMTLQDAIDNATV